MSSWSALGRALLGTGVTGDCGTHRELVLLAPFQRWRFLNVPVTLCLEGQHTKGSGSSCFDVLKSLYVTFKTLDSDIEGGGVWL